MLIYVSFLQIALVLYDLYVSNETHERRCRHKMVSCLQHMHTVGVTPRTCDLLPWLLHKLDERDGLLDVLASPNLLHVVYTR